MVYFLCGAFFVAEFIGAPTWLLVTLGLLYLIRLVGERA